MYKVQKKSGKQNKTHDRTNILSPLGEVVYSPSPSHSPSTRESALRDRELEAPGRVLPFICEYSPKSSLRKALYAGPNRFKPTLAFTKGRTLANSLVRARLRGVPRPSSYLHTHFLELCLPPVELPCACAAEPCRKDQQPSRRTTELDSSALRALPATHPTVFTYQVH